MSFELSVRLPRDRVSTGDDCWVEYFVVNRGAAEALLHDPSVGGDHPPVFYLRGPRLEDQRLIQVGRDIPAEVLRVAPGRELANAFRLDEKVRLQAGVYEVRAVLDPVGLNAQSNRAILRVSAFEAAAWSCVPFGLPSPDRVHFSWIRDSRYWEQALIEEGDVDQAPFDRESAVERAEVPPDASEPYTVAGFIDANDARPLRWIFWRVGQVVHSRGPALADPLTITLSPGTGSLTGVPLMGASHRADLLYASPSELVVARFCDPYVTPAETSGIVGRLPSPAAASAPAFGLDVTADRRHIVMAEVASGRLRVHHAAFTPADSITGFRVYEWEVRRDLAVIRDSRPAFHVQGNGSLNVRVIAGDSRDSRKSYVLDAVLDTRSSTPIPLTIEETVLTAEPMAARANIDPAGGGEPRKVSAWWLADGTLVAAGARGMRVARRNLDPDAPRELIALATNVYLIDTGSEGLSLSPL